MSDIETFRCYWVGYYVYSTYKEKTGKIHKITEDEDTFYYVLGWNIQQSYPEAYDHIITSISSIF